MPSVDSPGSPGLDPDVLTHVLNGLLADPRCCGLTLTVFDPDLDPAGTYAALLVALLGRALPPELPRVRGAEPAR